MNGLQIIELKAASFMDRVLRREPRENAFVEINNLLACVPIFDLDQESVNIFLRKYEISVPEARSRLLNFYTIILKHILFETKLEKTDLEKIHHLRHILSLEDREISRVHKNLVQPVYRNHVRQAIADGRLSDEKRAGLEKIAERLYLPKEFARNLYVEEANLYLDSVLRDSIADGMLSDAEETELQRLARDLQVELRLSEDARKNLERCRYLWRLFVGKLPELSPPIKLKPGEKCAAFVAAAYYQVSDSHIPVKYSGYNELRGQNGIGFHSGSFQHTKVSGKVIRFVDQGTIYFTDQRILFNGMNGEVYFIYHNIRGGTFYQNGLLIEQKRGADRFFKLTADMPAIKLIFDFLMTKSRK